MKIICAPLTLNAMRLLDINDCPDSLLETIHLTDEEYKKLLISGAVETINKPWKK
jgi:inorganic pyrophosphatase